MTATIDDVSEPPRSRRKRMTGKERREQLIDVGRTLFAERGFDGTSIEEIAAVAGVSKPVLYQHFPGKLELYLALLDTQAEALSAAVHEALARTDDNRMRIHGVLTAYFEFVDRDDEDGAFRLIFETDLGNEPAVRSRVEGVTQKTMQAVADVVAIDTGLDRAAAELLATALTGAAQVAARWWLASDRPVSQAEAVGLLEGLLWRGISTFPRHGDAG